MVLPLDMILKGAHAAVVPLLRPVQKPHLKAFEGLFSPGIDDSQLSKRS